MCGIKGRLAVPATVHGDQLDAFKTGKEILRLLEVAAQAVLEEKGDPGAGGSEIERNRHHLSFCVT